MENCELTERKNSVIMSGSISRVILFFLLVANNKWKAYIFYTLLLFQAVS